MKTFLYSKYTRAFFVLLFLVSLTLGVLDGVRGGLTLLREEDFTKDIGRPLEESYHFRNLLNIPENELVEAYWNYAVGLKGIPETKKSDFYEELRQRLKNHPQKERIQYYINLDGLVFSNVKDPKTLKQGFYKYYANNPYGLREFYSGGGAYLAPDVNHNIILKISEKSLTVAVRIAPYYVEEYTALLNRQEWLFFTNGARILACALGVILSLIYLLCVCGREGKELWTDRIWIELHLLLAGGLALAGIYSGVRIVEAVYVSALAMKWGCLLCGLLVPLVGGVLLSCILSMVRNLRAGRFAQRCVALIALKALAAGLLALCKLFWKGLRAVAKTLASLRGANYALVQTGLLFLYSLVFLLLSAETLEGNGIALLLLLLLLGAAIVFLARKNLDMAHIQRGVTHLRNGDLSHRIAEPKSHHLQSLAEDINHIAMGMDASVAARVRAEQMKTELITNVSHDLKTPLTSIITYTELLSRVEGLPEEARDYLRIIEGKSQRLKSLTQDLFDISKAQSGNEEVQWELLDASLLLEQSLAEENGAEHLQFCLKTEENLTFMGDGRKLSRVLGNLIQNASKYALPGTRVFLSACREGDRVVMECKNTSAYPLDFSPEEILGRFVRGDSARSTEGNGLGLPIAKSYTELCGGTFRLVLDGDLFKVRMTFPLAC